MDPMGIIPTPSFIKIGSQNATLSVATSSVVDVGTYNVFIIGTLNPILKASTVFILTVTAAPRPNLHAPDFKSSVKDFTVYIDQDYTYTFPLITDKDGDAIQPLSFTFDGNQALPNYILYDSVQNSL